MVAVRTYGPMPPTAIPSVIFAHAIGLHPNLVDWWTIAPDYVSVLNGDVDGVISRKRDAQGYAGHALTKVVSGPEYHDDQINGRAADRFVSAGFDRLEALGILPAGSFSMSSTTPRRFPAGSACWPARRTMAASAGSAPTSTRSAASTT